MSFLSFDKSSPFGPRSGSTHGERISQKRIVSPPKIISPVGERIRYLPNPVGPCAEAMFAPKRWSRTRNVNACACEASGPVGPKNSEGYTVLLNHTITDATHAIADTDARLYERYASPDHTSARRAHANGLVKMCQNPPRISIVPTQRCPPITSSMLSTLIIHPSPPNGDLRRYPKITDGSYVG